MSHVHEHVFSYPDVRPMYALVNTQNVSMNWTLELCEPERIIVIRQYYPDNNYREIIKPFSCANFTRHFDNEAGIYDEAQKNFQWFCGGTIRENVIIGVQKHNKRGGGTIRVRDTKTRTISQAAINGP